MATDPNAPITEAAAPEVDVTPAPVVDPTPETPAEATPAAEPAKPVVPAKYELVLPKDSPLPAATLERTATIARQLGLSNEAAQQMVEAVNAEAVALAKATDDTFRAQWEPKTGTEWKRQQNEWKTAALSDIEIGGTPEKLKASTEKAFQVVQKFFDPSVMEFLESSGLGSKPEFVKGFAKIGRAMGEGSLVLGTPQAAAQKSHAEILYGGSQSQQSAA